MKQGQLKSAIASKNKLISAILTILIEDIEYWECHEKGYFQSNCQEKSKEY